MFKLTLQSIRQLLVWTVLTGLVYPVVVTVIAQAAFRDRANGSLITQNGLTSGSALLGVVSVGLGLERAERPVWNGPASSGAVM